MVFFKFKLKERIKYQKSSLLLKKISKGDCLVFNNVLILENFHVSFALIFFKKCCDVISNGCIEKLQILNRLK